MCAGGGACGNAIPQLGVDLKALGFQRGLEVNGVQRAVRNLVAGGVCLVSGVNGSVAEHRNAGGVRQRQSVVLVAQQGRTLAHLVDVLFQRSGNGGCLCIGVVKIAKLALEVGRVANFARLDDLGGRGTQRGVDVACIGRGKVLTNQADHKQSCGRRGKT